MIKNPLGSEFFQKNIDSALPTEKDNTKETVIFITQDHPSVLTVKKISMSHWLFIEYQPPPGETLRFFPSKEWKLSEEFTC